MSKKTEEKKTEEKKTEEKKPELKPLEQQCFNLIKNAELAKEKWTYVTLGEKLKTSRTNVQLLVMKLQLKGYLKDGHREIIVPDLVIVAQAA